MNLRDSGPYRHSACSGQSGSAGRSVEARERSWRGIRRKICSSIGLRSSNNERSDAGDGGRRRRWEIGVGRLGEATWGFQERFNCWGTVRLLGNSQGETYRVGKPSTRRGNVRQTSGGVDQGANPPCDLRCRFDADDKSTRRANVSPGERFRLQVADPQHVATAFDRTMRRN